MKPYITIIAVALVIASAVAFAQTTPAQAKQVYQQKQQDEKTRIVPEQLGRAKAAKSIFGQKQALPAQARMRMAKRMHCMKQTTFSAQPGRLTGAQAAKMHVLMKQMAMPRGK